MAFMVMIQLNGWGLIAELLEFAEVGKRLSPSRKRSPATSHPYLALRPLSRPWQKFRSTTAPYEAYI